MKKYVFAWALISFLAVFLAVFLAMPAKAGSSVVAKTEKVSFNRHTYQVFWSEYSWSMMELYCETLGGHLACITSSEENDFLFNLSHPYGDAAFGFSDADKEGDWKWVNGESVLYTNWNQGEPNNDRSNEHWAYFTGNSKWNDFIYSGTSLYICEWDDSNLSSLSKDIVELTPKVSFNNHSYQALYSAYKWDDMKAYCEILGGHLATISSEEENSFLYNLSRDLREGRITFGFSDAEREGHWRWVTGESVIYTNWNVGEPNNSHSAEHWAYFQETGLWNDDIDGENCIYLCEWDFDNISVKNIKKSNYCIHVVDENGYPLKGVSVYWEDFAEVLTSETDIDGNAFFPFFTLGMPKIDVSLPGYASWSNRNSNWAKNDKRYSVVKLYPETLGDYKLSTALYSNSNQITHSIDLLTKTKKLNLKNDGNLIGDLDFGNFYLTCTACAMQGIDRYELWQNSKQISQCADGKFPRLSVTSFSKGGGCFVRVIAKSGEEVDTAINLEFAENKAKKDTKISLTSGAISFTLSDDVPYVGGRTFNVKMPFETGVTMSATEDKVQLGFNVSATDDSTIDQQLKKTRDLVRKAKRAGGFKLGKLSSKDQKIFESLIKDKNGWTLFKGLKDIDVNILGYAEMDIGSSVASGQLMIEIKIDPAVKFEYNAWVVVVPVTARVELGIGADIGSDFNYDFSTSTFDCKLSATPYAELTAFGGVGISKLIGVGAYGDAKIDWELVILPSPKTERLDLTGELGLKAYCAIWSYERPFAHNTWHLYTANSVNAVSLQSADVPWNSGLYDAGAYEVADLAYLSAESDWQGETASLMDAEARTVFTSLLTDTYRNAQPVMIATNSAIYAAFVRADASSGARYVVVTKFNGTSWSEPVRVDSGAILDSAPVLCVDGDAVYLAYARTTSDLDDSLLSYALKQEIVVGTIDPETLAFTEQAVFSGTNVKSSFVSMPQLRTVNGNMVLAWANATVSDDNSVLRPVSSVVRYASCVGGTWGSAGNLGTVNAPINSIALGEKNGSPAVACVLDEDDGSNLYLLTSSGQECLAENVSGRVSYGTLPGTTSEAFLWNTDSGLTSSSGDSVEVLGISGEYVVLGSNIYYSTATGGSTNLAVLQYHADTGTWGLPIQLTDGDRYLENLSVATLNGTDYVLGMHTAATITEDSVKDAKNLVWSAVRPVSDLRLDGIDYDAEDVVSGESVPVTLTVTNAGDHTVQSIGVKLDNATVKTENCSLKPGESLEITASVTVPQSLSEYSFTVEEPGADDYNPNDNSGTVQIGYADAALELDYQQIGTQKSLMATVTNQGVETASGSIVFYDADGNAAAESTFTDLASGDTTIAVFELDENFSGIHGGDVSAQVKIEQEELYTFNNSDTFHIMETESTPEETRIVSTASNSKGQANAEILCAEGTAATVYCAFYNGNGKIVDLGVRDLAAGSNSVVFTVDSSSAVRAKFMVLDSEQRPLCDSEQVTIA